MARTYSTGLLYVLVVAHLDHAVATSVTISGDYMRMYSRDDDGATVSLGMAVLTLVHDGSATASIVVPVSDASNNSRVAAAELQEHVAQLTGATLPIHTADRQRDASVDVQTRVFVGGNISALLRSHAPLPPEGYTILANGADLYLLGDDVCGQHYPNDFAGPCRQGTIFAVQAFLRDQLGIRWLWPGDTGRFIPPLNNTLQIDAALNVTSSPRLLTRTLGHPWKPTGWCKEYYSQPFARWLTGFAEDICLEHHEDTVLWQQRQLYGAHEMPQTGEGYGSSLWKKGSLDNLTGWQQRHSEYFALLPTGQRGPIVDHTTGRPELCPGPRCGQYVHMCVSDQALHERIVNDSLPAIAAGATGISAVDDDGGAGFCTCDRCRALDTPRLPANWDGSCTDPNLPTDKGRLSDRYAAYARGIYAELRRRLPDRHDLWVTTYAYECYHTPPRKIKYPNRTMTWLCAFNNYPSAGNSTAVDRAQWEAWTDAGASVVLRPNSLYYLGFGIPFNVIDQLAADVQFTGAHKMIGAEFDTMIGNHGTVGPLYYVLSRQLWDPSTSIPMLLEEYYSGFGAAADVVRAYWEFWQRVTVGAFGSNKAAATMKTYSGLNHKMTYVAAAYNESVFATAAHLLAAAGKLAGVRDGPKIQVLQEGLKHGLLTWRAYVATLNSTYCSSLVRGKSCDEGYVGGGLDKGGGYAEACTCDVRALMSAARTLSAYRESIRNSKAVNVFWTSWAEMNDGKAQDCNPCFGGYTGVHLAKFAGNLNVTTALSVSRWYLRFDPSNAGQTDRWFEPDFKLNQSEWHDESRIDMGWGFSRAGKAWASAHHGRSYTGIGWYRLQFRLPQEASELPRAIAFTIGRRDNPDSMRVYLNGSFATGSVKTWLNGHELGTIDAHVASATPRVALACTDASWHSSTHGIQTIVLRVNGSDGLSGRLWLL